MRSAGAFAFALLLATPVHAQTLVGASVAGITQSQSENTLGGTSATASVLFGAQASPRFAVDVEAVFSGAFTSDYVYSPKPGPVRVTLSRRDTFFLYNLRWRVDAIELVAGAGYIFSRTGRHARFVQGGRTYFENREVDHGLALIGGIDVPIAIGRRFALVPTVRVIVRPGGAPPEFGDSTYPGKIAFRYGAGARVAF